MSWFVAHCHGHAEAKARQHLNEQGFATYLPVYRKQRRHARRTEIAAAPLFPSYLFVAIDLDAQRWRVINSTRGIRRLICDSDDRPVPVPPGIVEALKEREVDGFIKLDRGQLRAGAKVKVLGGEFEDFLGRFDGATDRERVAILLEILGRSVRVVLPSDLIAAA